MTAYTYTDLTAVALEQTQAAWAAIFIGGGILHFAVRMGVDELRARLREYLDRRREAGARG